MGLPSMTEREFDLIFPPMMNGAEIKKRLTRQEYAGAPTSNVTPRHVGDVCLDTANNDWYIAHGLTSADWKIAAT